MAFEKDQFFYNQQLRTFILQFLAIFEGVQVRLGKFKDREPTQINVPVFYGQTDRVVAHIISGHTQNKPVRLPLITAYMREFVVNESRKAGVGITQRTAYTPVGGMVPQDSRVLYQRRPVPLDLHFDVMIAGSSQDQLFQMVEQIIPVFDNDLAIQPSDSPFDMARITMVRLESVTTDTIYPMQVQDNRVFSVTLRFVVEAYLGIPTDVRDNLIHKIFIRIGAVSTGAVTHAEMVAELDERNIPYDLFADGTNFDSVPEEQDTE